ncbi:hypothetical protein ACQ4N7_20040 [Nodosilinea sp. AN01ver1]|uniref:hypothetical protein n=1 Tax=Nodosilinea sp. AN01ver1 TaxID=3423362 RepID=UPI003D32282F
MNNNCESAQITLSTDADGRSWEHFWLGRNYIFSNQIPDRQSFTTTNPGEVIYSRGLCQWSAPPAGQFNNQANAATGGMSDGGFGVLVLLAAAGAGVWYYLNRGKQTDPNYSPHADLDISLPRLATTPTYEVEYIELEDGEELPDGYELVEEDGDDRPKHLVAQGNSTNGIPSVEPLEFARNSHEFEGNSQSGHANSQNGVDANSLGIPGVPADSHDWPPKHAAAPCDPLQPEQEGEFDVYRKHVDQDGLNPKGNDIIKSVWGVTPGRSAAYEAARRRRDEFAKRLDYYRYEEM